LLFIENSYEMEYKLLIGNNFIFENPKNVYYKNSQLFGINVDEDGPYIDTEIFDINGNKIVEIKKNNLLLCTPKLDKKVLRRDHLLIMDKNGEIIIESRLFDNDTIIISGTFIVNEVELTITQNYILLPDGKKIMHSRVKANNHSLIITENGIILKNNFMV
jgi:alpha-tubulin suppressor-like RCC1 family protein